MLQVEALLGPKSEADLKPPEKKKKPKVSCAALVHATVSVKVCMLSYFSIVVCMRYMAGCYKVNFFHFAGILPLLHHLQPHWSRSFCCMFPQEEDATGGPGPLKMKMLKEMAMLASKYV